MARMRMGRWVWVWGRTSFMCLKPAAAPTAMPESTASIAAASSLRQAAGTVICRSQRTDSPHKEACTSVPPVFQPPGFSFRSVTKQTPGDRYTNNAPLQEVLPRQRRLYLSTLALLCPVSTLDYQYE